MGGWGGEASTTSCVEVSVFTSGSVFFFCCRTSSPPRALHFAAACSLRILATACADLRAAVSVATAAVSDGKFCSASLHASRLDGLPLRLGFGEDNAVQQGRLQVLGAGTGSRRDARGGRRLPPLVAFPYGGDRARLHVHNGRPPLAAVALFRRDLVLRNCSRCVRRVGACGDSVGAGRVEHAPQRPFPSPTFRHGLV